MRDAICVWGDTGSAGAAEGAGGFEVLGLLEALEALEALEVLVVLEVLRWGLGGGACERRGVGVRLVAAGVGSGAGFSAGGGSR